MCGIVGVVGRILAEEEKVFKQLLEVDSLRGRHSTGVIKVLKGGAVETRKKAVDGMDFVKLEGRWIGSGVSRCLIGHNRYATKGAINDNNAHPFNHGHIYGVHNGTLSNQYALKDNRLFDVDSDNMFYDMAHNGMRDTAKRISGAWTIAMYNEQDKTFNMFRNKGRPMSVAITEDGQTMYFASESSMLEWVLDRNGVKYDSIVNLTVGKLITIDPNKIDKDNPIQDVIEITDIEYKPETVVPFVAKKKLTDFGLKENALYPISVVKELEANSNQGAQFEIELMVEPFNSWTVYSYQLDMTNRYREALANDTILGAKLSVGYNTNMPHAWSCDIKPATEETHKLLEEFNERIALEREEDEGYTAEELAILMGEHGFTMIDDWKDQNGNAMTDAEFRKTDAGQNGCCMCGDDFTDPDDVTWSETGSTAMCVDCVEQFERMYGNTSK